MHYKFITVILLFVISLTNSHYSTAQERGDIPPFKVFNEPKNESVKTSVNNLIMDYKTAWSSQDTRTLIKLHAHDVEWINAYARLIRGNQNLGKFFVEKLFPAFSSGVSMLEITNLKTISMRYIKEDSAIIHLYTDGNRGKSVNKDEKLRRTHIHLVLEKQKECWKIVHTAIMDAR